MFPYLREDHPNENAATDFPNAGWGKKRTDRKPKRRLSNLYFQFTDSTRFVNRVAHARFVGNQLNRIYVTLFVASFLSQNGQPFERTKRGLSEENCNSEASVRRLSCARLPVGKQMNN